MGIGNRDAGRWSRCSGCGRRLAAGRRGPLPKRCRKCQARRNNQRAVRARRNREDRMLEDLREVGRRMNRLASGLDAHAGAGRERLDEWVRAAVNALREDSGTLLKWEVEIARRRRRRRG